MLKKNANPKKSQGFTLIEILIVLVLMSVLAGALLTLQYILAQNQIVVWRSYISVNEANNNVTALVREVRTARYSDSGTYPLVTAEDNELIFYSDDDFDGQAERVRYFLDNATLSKGVIEPTSYPVSYPQNQEKVKVISENIRNGATPVFTYYNQDWPQDTINNPLTTPASPAQVKLIKIYLRLNTNDNQPNKDYIIESYTQVRTLKENL